MFAMVAKEHRRRTIKLRQRTTVIIKIGNKSGRKKRSTMKIQDSISRILGLNTIARYLKATCASGLLLLAVPLLAQAQFTYTTNDGSITITGYAGPGGPLTIPPVITGLPVTGIGTNAFEGAQLTSVTIPDSVVSIGDYAFDGAQITSISIPDSVTSIGEYAFVGDWFTSITIPDGVRIIGYEAFFDCDALESTIIGNSVTSIGENAFYGCNNLATVTIGNSVTNVGGGAFALTSVEVVFFQGNAPSAGSFLFENDGSPQIYYLPGTTGWGTNFAGAPTVLWNPQILTSDTGFGAQSNQFGFDIAFTNTVPVVVEATTNLVNPVWVPLQTVTITNGLFHFTEPFQTTNATRFYRLSPF